MQLSINAKIVSNLNAHNLKTHPSIQLLDGKAATQPYCLTYYKKGNKNPVNIISRILNFFGLLSWKTICVKLDDSKPIYIKLDKKDKALLCSVLRLNKDELKKSGLNITKLVDEALKTDAAFKKAAGQTAKPKQPSKIKDANHASASHVDRGQDSSKRATNNATSHPDEGQGPSNKITGRPNSQNLAQVEHQEEVTTIDEQSQICQLMLADPICTPDYAARAINILMVLAEQGHIGSNLFLERLYTYGLGSVKPDAAKALKFSPTVKRLKKECQAGSAEAAYELGNHYFLKGLQSAVFPSEATILKNYKKFKSREYSRAIKYMELAVERDPFLSGAKFRLGMFKMRRIQIYNTKRINGQLVFKSNKSLQKELDSTVALLKHAITFDKKEVTIPAKFILAQLYFYDPMVYKDNELYLKAKCAAKKKLPVNITKSEAESYLWDAAAAGHKDAIDYLNNAKLTGQHMTHKPFRFGRKDPEKELKQKILGN